MLGQVGGASVQMPVASLTAAAAAAATTASSTATDSRVLQNADELVLACAGEARAGIP